MQKLGRLSSSSSSSSHKLPMKMMIFNNNSNKSGQCKKHPKHKQSPGVCSLCLAEKLSRVPTTSTSRSLRPNYCSSSSLSSSEDSSYASSPPPPPHRHHRRIVSDVGRANEGVTDLSSASGVLKTRSMAFVASHDNKNKENKKATSGFWSKLLRPRKNKKLNVVDRKGLMMSSQSQPLEVGVSVN